MTAGCKGIGKAADDFFYAAVRADEGAFTIYQYSHCSFKTVVRNLLF